MTTILRSKQAGMTLLEIMVAMVIGLFLIAGLFNIFLSSTQTYRMQDNMSRMQENGRFAMDFIIRDMRMADYWGCLRAGLANVTNNLDPAGVGYDAAIHGYGGGIDGTEGAAGANAAVDASDTLIMRGAYDAGIFVEAPFGPQASANIKVTAGNGLEEGEIVLVADCTQADIFQITNANPSTSGTVVHNTGAAQQPGNNNVSNPGCPGANAHCLSKVFLGDAAIYKLASITYAIQNGAGGRPSLFRSFNGVNSELVEGIENMQILYGEDTNGDNTPDYYVPANDAGLTMDNVVSVRISLLVSSPDDGLTSQAIPFTYNGATNTPADNRLRRVITSTVAVRNRLP